MEKELAQHIINNVNAMRLNAQEMRMWKNIPLAQECVSMLKQLDDPEETPLGKALACQAIAELLPEYDVPRLVIKILKYELQLLQSTDDDKSQQPEEQVAADIARLEDYIDTEHVSDEEFSERYRRMLKADPIERTPLWEDNYYEAELECDRRLGDEPRGMGFCFAHWSTLRAVLSERGIKWRSPSEMNPHVIFD